MLDRFPSTYTEEQVGGTLTIMVELPEGSSEVDVELVGAEP
jgi:hypothetical protein